ncbi:hypothetical protein N7456_001833 [Penicillium angulare]|uniref:NACHT domain-containing protein n=1 Tax=Penicillium angulare TaxID=116970 RepID=A0A9W9G788_9EURO|nr:hypothetical protein N7456_001833 [Penicillium angulare]
MTSRFIYLPSDPNREVDEACWKGLMTTFPRDDMLRIQYLAGGLLKDSYAWILQNPEYKKWVKSEINLLRITGDSGKGKTMLLCGIIDELMGSSTGLRNISYFFCQATDARLNNATAVLRGVILMLLRDQTSLISHIRARYYEIGMYLFDDSHAWRELSTILKSMLKDPTLEKTSIIIDGLDECIVDFGLLVHLIAQLSRTQPHVKWIVSSRDGLTIEDTLESVTRQRTIRLDLNEACVTNAIEVFIKHKLHQLFQENEYDDKLRSEVSSLFSKGSKNNFLWVELVWKQLMRAPRWKALSTLKSSPSELTVLYIRMMERIGFSEDSSLFKAILAIASTVFRPIKLPELVSFLDALKKFSDDTESLRDIIGYCAPFLTVRDNTLLFVHHSAQDVLLNVIPGQVFQAGIKIQHNLIFSKSLENMSKILRRNMYDLSEIVVEYVNTPSRDPLAPVRYSCLYWVDHLIAGYSKTQATSKEWHDDLQAVHNFLSEKFLYWVEALSLMGQLFEGLVIMQKLSDFIKGETWEHVLSEFVGAGCRFIDHCLSSGKIYPPRIYSSALSWSRNEGSARIMFKEGDQMDED